MKFEGIKAAKDLDEKVIRPTDKTAKHCIDSKENYNEKMEKHIKDDPVMRTKMSVV